MLVKFEQNCMVQTTRYFELYDKKTNKQTKNKKTKNKKKTGFFKTIFDKAFYAILEDVSVDETFV